ncbi:MAG: cytochrome B, partial [Bacteroidota bacterium]
VRAVSGWLGKKEFTATDRKVALFAFIFTHIQLLLGILLYMISPKVQFVAEVMDSIVLRFYTVEHFSTMLFGIALITIGYSSAKRSSVDIQKHRKIALFYGFGLLLILVGIPWPFRAALGAGWF